MSQHPVDLKRATVAGTHLQAANQSTVSSTAQGPATVARCMDPLWHYTPSGETDIRRTWARHGFFPTAVRRPR